MIPHAVVFASELGVLALLSLGSFVGSRMVRHLLGLHFLHPFLLSFGGMSAFGAVLEALPLAFPLLARNPLANGAFLVWLSLSIVLTLALLASARGRKQSGALLILLLPLVIAVIMNIGPILPPRPPLVDLVVAWTTLVTVTSVPYWLIRNRLVCRGTSQSRRLVPLKTTLNLSCSSCICALSGSLYLLHWHKGLLGSLPSAFVWASAGLLGLIFLDSVRSRISTLYLRGAFQPWLEPVEEAEELSHG